MYVLVIEFDRTRGGETRREKRLWTFSERDEAERESQRFVHLVHAGNANFIRGGDKLTFQESRLYQADTDDAETAKQHVSAGNAPLLHHAFNPALRNSSYWEEVLTKLDEGVVVD